MEVFIHGIDALVTLDDEQKAEVRQPDEYQAGVAIDALDKVQLGDLIGEHSTWVGDVQIDDDKDVMIKVAVRPESIPGLEASGVNEETLIAMCATELDNLGLAHTLCNKAKVIEPEGTHSYRIKAGPVAIGECEKDHSEDHTCTGFTFTDVEAEVLNQMWDITTLAAPNWKRLGYGPDWFRTVTGMDGMRGGDRAMYEILSQLLSRAGIRGNTPVHASTGLALKSQDIPRLAE